MEDKQQELFRKIRSGDYDFIEEDWAKISDEAVNLIKGLLVVDPDHRLTVDEALSSPWFDECHVHLSGKCLATSIDSLKDRRQKLRSGNAALMWCSINPHLDPVPHPHCPHKDTIHDNSNSISEDEEMEY